MRSCDQDHHTAKACSKKFDGLLRNRRDGSTTQFAFYWAEISSHVCVEMKEEYTNDFTAVDVFRRSATRSRYGNYMVSIKNVNVPKLLVEFKY